MTGPAAGPALSRAAAAHEHHLEARSGSCSPARGSPLREAEPGMARGEGGRGHGGHGGDGEGDTGDMRARGLGVPWCREAPAGSSGATGGP